MIIIDSADIWILAKEFGAECSAGWNSRVTHLVAGDVSIIYFVFVRYINKNNLTNLNLI
jgi:hypothetical protein